MTLDGRAIQFARRGSRDNPENAIFVVQQNLDLVARRLVGDEVDINASLAALTAALTAARIPAGAEFMWPGAVAPTGYLLEDGGLYLRATYPDLFAVVSTTYNVGGEAGTEFRVPKFSGRVPVGLDAGQTEFDVMGEQGGAKTHTLTTGQIPSHTHTQELMDPGVLTPVDLTDRPARMSGGAINSNAFPGIQSAGGGAAHNNLQPYMVRNFIIKT